MSNAPPASVCLDETNLPISGEISEECQRAASSSAFFVAFVSPGYAGSKYCAQEIEAFVAAGHGARRALGKTASISCGPTVRATCRNACAPFLMALNGPICLTPMVRSRTFSAITAERRAIRLSTRFSRGYLQQCLASRAELWAAGQERCTPLRHGCGLRLASPTLVSRTSPRSDRRSSRHCERVMTSTSWSSRTISCGSRTTRIGSRKILRNQLAQASLLVLITSGREQRPPFWLMSQRAALPKGGVCLSIHVGNDPAIAATARRAGPVSDCRARHGFGLAADRSTSWARESRQTILRSDLGFSRP